MDMKEFFQDVRRIEESIRGESVVIVSLQTKDGGKAGVLNEVAKKIAARTIAEAKARLATEEEAEGYRADVAESLRAAAEQNMANQVRLSIIPESDLRALRSSMKPAK
jgi:hypothetical protein